MERSKRVLAVAGVTAGGLAARAGVRAGDQVLFLRGGRRGARLETVAGLDRAAFTALFRGLPRPLAVTFVRPDGEAGRDARSKAAADTARRALMARRGRSL